MESLSTVPLSKLFKNNTGYIYCLKSFKKIDIQTFYKESLSIANNLEDNGVKQNDIIFYCKENNIDYLKYREFNAKWALNTNELLDIFKGMRIHRYRDYDDAREAYSSIIAQKP